MSLGLTLLFIGTTHCGNCTKFKPEWQKLKDGFLKGDFLNIPGYDFTLQDYVVSDHDALPPALQSIVTFYPFIILLPTDYLEQNLNNTDDKFSLVGEAMYTYRSMKDGKMTYRLGSSVNDSPNMRYARTAEGIDAWIRESAIASLQILSAKYYSSIEFPEVASSSTNRRNVLRMQALARKADERLEMFIPPLNKEYRVVSGGLVMCRRILNVHG